MACSPTGFMVVDDFQQHTHSNNDMRARPVALSRAPLVTAPGPSVTRRSKERMTSHALGAACRRRRLQRAQQAVSPGSSIVVLVRRVCLPAACYLGPITHPQSPITARAQAALAP